jgi:hypothetical protein
MFPRAGLADFSPDTGVREGGESRGGDGYQRGVNLGIGHAF